MIEQDQKSGLKWRNLALLFLLPVLTILLLLYLLSPQQAIAPGTLSLETSQDQGKNLAQPHAAGAMAHQVTREGDFLAKSKSNTGSHTGSPNLLCDTPSPKPSSTPSRTPSPTPSPTPTPSPGCVVDLSVTPLIQSAVPGETLTYTLTVSNTGIHMGIAGIKADGPEGWPSPIVRPAVTRTLSPGGSADWQAILAVPPCEPPGDQTTRITAVLTCTAIDETSAASRNIATTVLITPVAAIEPGIVKTIQVMEDILRDGTKVLFTHRITNIGNLEDTFAFTVHSAQVAQASPGWSVQGPDPKEQKLAPCEFTTTTFTVTVPPGLSTVSDTLVITATPQLAPAYSATTTDKIRDGRVFLPTAMNNFKFLCNGDFETGDLSCWSHFPYYYGAKDQLPVQVVSDPAPSSKFRALLGSPDFQCWQGVPTGRAWMTQTFTVPIYDHSWLSFRYEMHTQHTIDYDTFEVFLETQEDSYQILKVGQSPPKSGCKEDPNVITGTYIVDLTNLKDWEGNSIDVNFKGKNVTLRFENWNRVLIYYNTWTYVDDIKFTW